MADHIVGRRLFIRIILFANLCFCLFLLIACKPLKLSVTNTALIADLSVGPGFSGRAGFGLKFVKMFRADFGPAYRSFSQKRTLVATYC